MKLNRRNFIQNLGATAAVGGFMISPQAFAQHAPDNINIIGPRKGFTPQIGTLVSMLDWITDTTIRYHNHLNIEQLDYIFDEDSNSIGALMMHLAATEVIYQDITFKGLDDFSAENKKKWGTAMNLGEQARKEIGGNDIAFYQNMFEEVRKVTLDELKKRDDKWLLSGETKDWNWNNYCKWFHVVEHYANHRGQMTWIAKRIPS